MKKNALNPEELIKKRFSDAGINVIAIEKRDFPEETIFITRVSSDDYSAAANIGNDIDSELQEMGFDGFITVRKSEQIVIQHSAASLKEKGVSDSRALQFSHLLIARSRTSEVQPSLSYIPDTSRNISKVTTTRHQLIFGRRGAGKTALMVEAKHIVESQDCLTVWLNVQAIRNESADRCFLWFSKNIIEAMQSAYKLERHLPAVLSKAATLLNKIENMLSRTNTQSAAILALIPQMQSLLRRFLTGDARRMYIFVDELHYMPINEQPKFLDHMHSVCRDSDAWLKIAAIRHLSRWFQSSPPLGLETGHDADHIDLDVTLQNPTRAKSFLEAMLKSYARHVEIHSIYSVFSMTALDRLVLASGAVPRDYLVLCAAAIQQAQQREKSRVVGVQDVNKAAGDAAQFKIAELEDDAASLEGKSKNIAFAALAIRRYCLEEKKYTYFRIDFRDKELHPLEYSMIQSLMDLRVVHLVNSSLSDEREAGRRSEVFMLDLSYFSSQRLKKHLKALDFESGHLVLKQTGTSVTVKVGDTANKLLGLLRRAPLYELSELLANSDAITS